MYVDVPAPMISVRVLCFVSFVPVSAYSRLEECTDRGNLALGKPAYQSSTKVADRTGKLARADRAVDGVYNNEFYECNSCSFTKYSKNPWWAVDLLDEYFISSVQITASTRVGNFQGDYRIFVGRSFEKINGIVDPVLCAIIRKNSPQVPGSTVTYTCPQPIAGRYVMVTLTGFTTVMTLCEVAVKGVPTRTDASKENVKPVESTFDVCQRTYSKSLNNQLPSIDPIGTADVKSLGDCAEKCSTTERCLAFAVNKDPSRKLQNYASKELQCLLFECSTSFFKAQNNTTFYVRNN